MRRLAIILGTSLCVIWLYIFVADQIWTAVPSANGGFLAPAFYLQLIPGMVLTPVLPEWAVDPIRGICVNLPLLSVSGSAVVYLLPGICVLIAGLYPRHDRTKQASKRQETRLPDQVANADQRQTPPADKPGG